METVERLGEQLRDQSQVGGLLKLAQAFNQGEQLTLRLRARSLELEAQLCEPLCLVELARHLPEPSAAQGRSLQELATGLLLLDQDPRITRLDVRLQSGACRQQLVL